MGRVLGVGWFVLVTAISLAGQAQKTVWDGVHRGAGQARGGRTPRSVRCVTAMVWAESSRRRR